MSYIALYRKFRPSSFSDVQGQDAVVKTLKNQIRMGRVGHAYLFCGTRGTGKTSVAKVFAKAANCLHPVDGDPCNECEICRKINAGASLNVIEIDAASNNGVDNIRDLIDDVAYRPSEGTYRVYIIDEAHMVTTAAFNALLKTLEEPPSHAIFILATTEASQIPVTILSRCQRYDFHRIPTEVIADHLEDLAGKEEIRIDARAIRYIARRAEGSMRDALSLLDQCASFMTGEEITYDDTLKVLGAVDTSVYATVLSAIYEGRTKDCLEVFDSVLKSGKDPAQFLADFTWYIRNVLLVKSAGSGADSLVEASADQLQQMQEIANDIAAESLMRYLRNLSEASSTLRFSTNRRIDLELALIRLSRPQMERGETGLPDRVRITELRIQELSDRIVALQTRMSGGATVPSPVQTEDGFVRQEESPFTEQEEMVNPKSESETTDEGAGDRESVVERMEPNVSSGDPDVITMEWPSILGGIKNRFAKQMLYDARPYIKEEEPDTVYIPVTHPLAVRLPDDEALIAELEGSIERRTGLSLRAVILLKKDKGQEEQERSIDELLRERIHMPIDNE